MNRKHGFQSSGVVGLTVAILALAQIVYAAPTLTGGTVNGAPGYTVNLPINFNPSPNTVVGVQFQLTLPNGMSAGTPIAGTTLGPSTGNKVAMKNGSVGLSTYVVVGMFSPAPATGACSGSVLCGNTNAIANGKLMDVPVTIAAGTAVGTHSIGISRITYVDAAGNAVAGGTSTSGTINVGQFSPCDVNQNSSIGATDIQREILWMLSPPCPLPLGDVTGDGACGATDLQRIILAVLSGGLCVSP